MITQLTIGYGDIQPLGVTRYIVIGHGFLTLVLAVFAVSRVIAFLPSIEPVIHDDK